ncbi:MAG: cytochrome c [Flavobacteriales bacterium]|nr:cytochrome c [Flavobacteriales bacterium]MCB9364011.1 cytochrome c [Flavobacteriales bacterium]
MLTKSQAKLFFLAGTVIFSVLFLGLSIDTHLNRVGEQTHEENITEGVIAGKHLWEENNCMGCHTIMGEGAYYAPELTKVVERRGVPYIKGVLMSPTPWGEHTSGRKMVAYGFSDEEANNLVEYLTWIGNIDLNGFPAKPQYKVEKNN